MMTAPHACLSTDVMRQTKHEADGRRRSMMTAGRMRMSRTGRMNEMREEEDTSQDRSRETPLRDLDRRPRERSHPHLVKTPITSKMRKREKKEEV